jgi:hypothetical protein
MATLKEPKMWFIGTLNSSLPTASLPTNLNVLNIIQYFHSVEKNTLAESFKKSAQSVQDLWNKLGRATCLQKNVIYKMKMLVQQYNKLKKNKDSVGPTQISKEDDFSKYLKNVFDIAHISERASHSKKGKFIKI